MNPVDIHSIYTVVLTIIFVGIWAWAWSGKRKTSFDAAARLPLEEESRPANAGEERQ